VEETLSRTQRELARAQENNAKLQRDLRENQAQKVDQVIPRWLTRQFQLTLY